MFTIGIFWSSEGEKIVPLWTDLKRAVQYVFTQWPDSNPGRPGELVSNPVAMSKCTNWPPKLTTYMVIDYCTLIIQSCIIHLCVRSNTLIKMVYCLLLYHKCTISYYHICNQILKLLNYKFSGNIATENILKNGFL